MNSNTDTNSNRSEASLDEVIYELCVNFLLYVVLIIVFYMLVRFYLEEETVYQSYTRVATNDIDGDENENENEKKEKISNNNKSTTTKTTPIDEKEKKIYAKSKLMNVNEWGEPEGTKEEVVQQVAICSCGLIISFCIWGLLQERILTQTYDGEYYQHSYGLVFQSRLGGLLLSATLMRYSNVSWENSPLWEYSFPSVANMLSSWCQYEALQYVSFPAQMLAKAFKMVPVMLMGKFLHNKDYESFEYISASMVGFGLYLFLDSSEKIDFSQNVFGNTENVHGSMCGLVLLLLYLFFDSFTSQWQTRMFQLNKSLNPLQMMLIMNTFSAVFSFVTLVHQAEVTPAFMFMVDHPLMGFHVVLFCLAATIGQLFIFYTVKHFGAVVFSIIMSMRILMSTVLSCLVYSHPITELGFLGKKFVLILVLL